MFGFLEMNPVHEQVTCSRVSMLSDCHILG